MSKSILASRAVTLLFLGAFLYALSLADEARAECISDAEIEAEVGNQVRAGAFAVNTAKLGDRPLCSGLTMAQAIQELRNRYFPSGGQSRKISPDAMSPPASATTSVAKGSASWQFSQDPANPDYTAQASVEVPVRYGETVTLFIDCQKDVIGAMVGYSSNSVNLPEPRRTMVNQYMRDIFIESPVLVLMQGATTLGRINWHADNGGNGKIGAVQMHWLLKADKARLAGGKQSIDFPMNGAPQALAGVMRQCRMMPG